ncbi:M14 family metallocarboxypeptidase [Bacillus sp. AFS041924]|uniref:M14 family metallopeptidase n=1 Tax=Bacillus sp. AFS041924 TaxID=2033503 RepID=UPI0020D26312|nr:M14 family metallocarboxypeptidase [Bacillus sp. AFS041924]
MNINNQPFSFHPRRYDFNELSKDIRVLVQEFPFLRLSTIGRSVLDLPLYEIQIGNGQRKVHWNGSFHANEWITTCVIMKMISWVCNTLTSEELPFHKELLALFSENTLSIVPMVNPDGVNLVINEVVEQNEFMEFANKINEGNDGFTGWKANIRGVDLNNQFPANWELEKERKKQKTYAPRDYPGDTPLSEPETIAMSNLAIERQFDLILALHTQGKEFYWGYGNFEPPISEVYANYFSSVSPYKAVKTIDSHAGYKDWYIQEFQKPGFTLELGKGINPLPLSMFESIFSETFPILLASLFNLENFNSNQSFTK